MAKPLVLPLLGSSIGSTQQRFRGHPVYVRLIRRFAAPFTRGERRRTRDRRLTDFDIEGQFAPGSSLMVLGANRVLVKYRGLSTVDSWENQSHRLVFRTERKKRPKGFWLSLSTGGARALRRTTVQSKVSRYCLSKYRSGTLMLPGT